MLYSQLELNQSLTMNGTTYHVDSYLPWWNLLRPYIYSVSMDWKATNEKELPEVFYVINKSGQLHIPGINRAGRVLPLPIERPLEGDIDMMIPTQYTLADFKLVG